MHKTLFQTAFILLFCTTVVAQQTQSSGVTDNGVTAAFSSTYSGGYPVTGIDTVNLYNGHVSLNLPLGRIGARGSVGYEPAISISRTFLLRPYQYWSPAGSSGVWYPPKFKVISERYNDGFNYSNFQPGLLPAVIIGRRTRDANPSVSGTITPYCNALTKLYLRMAGGEIELRDVGTNGEPHNDDQGQFNRGREWHTVDGSGMLFVSDTDIKDETCGDRDFPAMNGINVLFPTGDLMLQDGTHYRFVQGYPIWMRDRNGNTIAFSGASGAPEVTDSILRKYQLSYAGVTYKDHSGTNQTVEVIASSLSSALRSDFAAAGVKDLQTLIPGVLLEDPTGPFNPNVTKTVRLPNGLEYQFFYTQYGELARIELPTGGIIEYDYPAVGVGVAGGSSSPQLFRPVAARRIYDSPGHLQARQTFEYSFPYPGPDTTVTAVKTYDVADLVVRNERHAFKGMVHTDFQSTAWYQPFDNGREITIETLDAAGTVLRRVDNTWQTLDINGSPTTPPLYSATHPTNLDCALTAVKATLSDTNQATQTTFAYDGYGNKTDTYSYDFGSPGSGSIGVLLRRTHTDFNYDSLYVQSSGPHILNLVSRQWVSADAYGTNKLAQTEFEYDNYASDSRHAGLVSRANIAGSCLKLDDTATNCLQAPDSSYTKRGNLTQTTTYYDIPNSGVVINALQYDIAGNVVKAIDARGYESTLDYTDRFGAPDNEARGNSGSPALNSAGQYSYAFATLVTNAMGHQNYTQFNYYVGQPVDTEDANLAVTSLYYDDVLDRLTKINLPDGGRKTNTYVDAHQCGPYVETKILFDTGRETDSLQFFDGLGNAVRAFTYENQDANNQWLTADTQYDSLGRAARVSNPYRSAGCTSAVNPSGNWTATAFDALSRVLSGTTPDNAVMATSYSGATVTVTDQAGKQRRTMADALGRLLRVDEPDANNSLGPASSPNQPTIYTYDAVGNLRTVTQGAQTRTFTYDGLSRLISATNPENGTSNYTYDNNGNLTQKSNARLVAGTQTHVTVTYEYDALNRLKTRTYNDGTAPSYTDRTPTVTYAYDSTSISHGKGRLASVSSTVSTYTYGAYDAVGRPQSASETLGGQTYSMSYTYYLAGHVKSITYPSLRTVNYNYDAMGRLGNKDAQNLAFKGNLGDGVQRTYSAGILYSPFGGMSIEEFGTDTPIYHKRQYNVRGQLWDIRASTGADPDGTWNRGALQVFYDQAGSFGGSGLDNNGNVLATKHYRPLDEQSATWAISTDTYIYDELNRLKSVAEKHVSSTQTETPQLKQTYYYDRFGNRRIDTNPAETWGGVNNIDFELESGTNRLYAPGDLLPTPLPENLRRMQYDPGGNLKKDTYTGAGDREYDAENRMTKAWGGNNQWQEYAYNAEGQRVRRKVDGTETWQVYGMDGELLAEYAANVAASTPLKEYGYRNGQLLVTAKPAAQINWLVADQLGTPRIILDKTGALANVKRHDYLPFGEELTTQGLRNTIPGYSGDTLRQKFTLKERDNETGLDYSINRYYSSGQGRFTSVDPENAGADLENPQSWNGYAYAFNSPLKYQDPDGLTVRVCGTDGQCTEGKTDLSDADFYKYFRDAKGIKIQDGNIYQNGNLIGTYQRQSFDDLNDFANGVIFGRGQTPGLTKRLEPVQKVVTIGAAIDVGLIASVYVGVEMAGAGVKSLGLDSLAGRSIQGLNSLIRGTQKELLSKLFGNGVQGARQALASGQLPAGLTREALLVYAEVAKRYIDQGRDATGVQALRLEIITQALEKLK